MPPRREDTGKELSSKGCQCSAHLMFQSITLTPHLPDLVSDEGFPSRVAIAAFHLLLSLPECLMDVFV